jgi:hypothetical protein
LEIYLRIEQFQAISGDSLSITPFSIHMLKI